ncbi:tape measure protein [Nitrobacter sp. TKz-YC01]|uniref:tape measure protein n=1 Tax=Nitrobacter sp. TKz-YC01 TaxID=3398703 RepID=UPI003A102C03
MAQDLDQMVLSISADTRQIQRALKKLETDSRASTKNIEKQFDGLGKKVSGSFAGLGKGMVGAIAAAFSVREAQKFIDTATRIDNALKVAGLSGEQLTKVYDALFVSAQKNAAPLEALVQLYGRATLVQKELGVSTEQLLKFTDNVAVALRVSGKSAAESSGALLQLSQALGSGVVRAEEFNSMLEGALPIVQAAANGITEAGGSVSKLRQLVVDGKVSSAAFFKGFQAGAVMLNQQVAGASLTVAQGFERLQNAAVDAAKRINDASGASRAATSALDTLSTAVTKLADAFSVLASSKSLQDTNKGLDALGAAAQNLWNDPSFQNLYRFLFDTSGSLAQRAAGDAIASRAEGFNALRKAMSAANAEADKAAAKKPTAASRFDDAFSPFAAKKVSLADNPVTAAAKKASAGASAERDTFERRLAMTQRQIDLMGVEASTIDQTAAARERARVVVELETAAREANHRAGKANTDVTEAQRAKINELADAYAKAREQLEQLNGPLATFARESANIGQQLEQVAVSSLDRMSDELAEVITGTRSVADAFKSMSNLILHELARIAIKKAILGPIAGMLGGGGGSNILSSLIPKFANGTNFAPGGPAIVGERGPELVNLPRGAQVVPNYKLPKLGRSTPSQTFAPVYQIDARGADAGAVERIRGVLAQHAKAIAGQGKAMQSAQRFQSTGVA